MTVALIVTCRRNAELRRLLDGLGRSGLPLGGAVIVDHAADKETERLVNEASFSCTYVADASNPGPGAGWRNAMRMALEVYSDVTRFWFLDDDVVIAPDIHQILVEEMQKAKAGAIAPLLEDDKGCLWGFPEPLDVPARSLIREAKTPGDALRLLGSSPYRFVWCTGACFLVIRPVVEAVGPHRTDFWMLGEDLEFSMRVASVTKAIFTCRAVVPHLPHPAVDSQAAALSAYRKFLSLLQNISYLAFHSVHSAHLRFYVLGNLRRFIRTYGWRYSVFRHSLHACWNGAFRGQPAGRSSGMRLRESVSQIHVRPSK